MELNKQIQKIVGMNKHYISPELANRLMENEYQRQAIEFLIQTDTECHIEKIGKSVPSWGKEEVNTYRVTLKNSRNEYSFLFWDSIANTESPMKRNFPSHVDFYSILACLNVDYFMDFDDFCANYGYQFNTERDYIKVKQTYLNVREETRALQQLFSESELEKLHEMN